MTGVFSNAPHVRGTTTDAFMPGRQALGAGGRLISDAKTAGPPGVLLIRDAQVNGPSGAQLMTDVDEVRPPAGSLILDGGASWPLNGELNPDVLAIRPPGGAVIQDADDAQATCSKVSALYLHLDRQWFVVQTLKRLRGTLERAIIGWILY